MSAKRLEICVALSAIEIEAARCGIAESMANAQWEMVTAAFAEKHPEASALPPEKLRGRLRARYFKDERTEWAFDCVPFLETRPPEVVRTDGRMEFVMKGKTL